jgi:hypothetical protein
MLDAAGSPAAPTAAAAGHPAPPPPPLYAAQDDALLASAPIAFVREFRLPLLHALMGTVTLANLTQENLCCLNAALLLLVAAHRHGALPALLAQLVAYDAAVRAHKAALLAGGGESEGAQLPPAPLRLPSLRDELAQAGSGGSGSATALRLQLSSPADSSRAAGTSPGTAAAASDPAASPLFAGFARLLAWWLEYYSLRDRDRRQTRSVAQYAYEEWRAVARALLGLDPGAPATGLMAPIDALGIPAAALALLRRQQQGQGQGQRQGLPLRGEALDDHAAPVQPRVEVPPQVAALDAAAREAWVHWPPHWPHPGAAGATADERAAAAAYMARYWAACRLPGVLPAVQ